MSEKPKKKKRSVASKYPTRQALVYSGAAFLIVIVGLKTVLNVNEEGFGLIEYLTIGGLALEFSMLLLYAWTIYTAGKEAYKQTLAEEAAAEEEQEEEDIFEISPQDIPEFVDVMATFASKSGKLSTQIAENNLLLKNQAEELKKVTEGMNKLIDEQVSLKVRQEIQRILSAK